MPRRGLGNHHVFRDHVVVAQASHTTWAHCSMSLRFDRERSRGSLSIRLLAQFEEAGSPQLISLYLAPHNINQMDASSGAERIPPSIVEHIRQEIGVRSLDDMLIISISTSAPGRLICPEASPTLTPINGYEPNVRSFRELCRATKMRLYLPASDLSPSRRLALDDFIRMSTANQLTPININLSQYHARRPACEATWHVFNIPEPLPPYVPPQAAGKRARQASPSDASAAAAKRAAGGDGPGPSTSSRAHVPNTTDFDTDSDSDSEAELLTYASPGSKQHQQRRGSDSADFNKMIVALRGMVSIELATQLPDMMRTVLPKMLPELLRTHLSGSLQDDSPASEDSHDNDTPPPLITNYVQPLVVAHLLDLIHQYMDENVDVYDIVATAKTEVAEERDYAIIDVKEARDECLGDIAAAQTEACERLHAACCDCCEVRGLTPPEESSPAPRRVAVPLGLGLPSESSSQGSSAIRYKRHLRPPERRQVVDRGGAAAAEPVLVAGQAPQPGGGHNRGEQQQQQQQQHAGAQMARKATTTTENDNTTDEHDTTDEEDNATDEDDDRNDEEHGMIDDDEDDTTDRQDDATAGHDDSGPTAPGDDEPGQQDEGRRTHEPPIQHASTNAAGRTGRETAAAPPPSSKPSAHSQQGDGDAGDQMETDCTPTQEDSDNSGLVAAYRRELHAAATALESAPGGAARRSSSSPAPPGSSPPPRPGGGQTGGGRGRSAASTQAEERNCGSDTQVQYAQVVDDCLSVPSDRSSSAQPSPAQPQSELRMREHP